MEAADFWQAANQPLAAYFRYRAQNEFQGVVKDAALGPQALVPMDQLQVKGQIANHHVLEEETKESHIRGHFDQPSTNPK